MNSKMEFQPLVVESGDDYRDDGDPKSSKTNSKIHSSPTTLSTKRLRLLVPLVFLCGIIASRTVTILFSRTNSKEAPSFEIDDNKEEEGAEESIIDSDKSMTPISTASVEATSQPAKIECIWGPKAQDECKDFLNARLPYSQPNRSPSSSRIGHRWLFFGDSTMTRLVRTTNLSVYLARKAADRINKECPDKFECDLRLAKKCMYNEKFDLEYRRNMDWTPPDYLNKAEGPRDVPNEPYCVDCGGCRSEFVVCKDLGPNRTCNGLDAPVTHGGLITVEFARDVEMQSPEFLTTQENVAAFMARSFSPQSIVDSLGKPVCVVNTGTHDSKIPKITTEKFMTNLKWYLGLLEPQCEHIIYLATVAPEADRFPGHIALMYEWNIKVHEFLATDAKFQEKSTFINVFNTSKEEEHDGKIHMEQSWYDDLASLFMPLIDK